MPAPPRGDSRSIVSSGRFRGSAWASAMASPTISRAGPFRPAAASARSGQRGHDAPLVGRLAFSTIRAGVDAAAAGADQARGDRGGLDRPM